MSGWLWFLIQFIVITGFIVYLFIAAKKAKKLNKMTWFMKLWKKDSVKSIASSLLSIILGLLIGCVILIVLAIVKVKGTTLSFSSYIEFDCRKRDAARLKDAGEPISTSSMILEST